MAKIDENELRQAMHTVLDKMSLHDLRNVADFDGCCYCPEWMKAVCDSEPECAPAWIKAAEKINREKKE